MTVYQFRAADETDTETLFTFLTQLAEHEGRLDQFKLSRATLHEALQKDGTIKSLLCDYNGQSVGAALWCDRFSPYAGGTNLLLIDLYVVPEHRQAGIGKAFMQELQKIAADKNYVRIEWFVDADNDDAKRFYSKMGGERIPHSEHWKLVL